MNTKKLRYAILKEISKGNKDLSENDFKITEYEFDEAIRFLDREGYLKGIPYADGRPLLFEESAYLTEKGEEYLQENTILAKSYQTAKEIRDWIK